MNRNENTELTVETLLALRSQENAAQLIAEKLRVKEMGPADHIRTKHEVKGFIETGDVTAALNLLKSARERIAGILVMKEHVVQKQAQTNRI